MMSELCAEFKIQHHNSTPYRNKQEYKENHPKNGSDI